MTDKVNATLKVYYIFNDTKCLAKGGIVAANPIAPGADVATIDLRTCALAVCSSSPELIGDQSVDYAIYSLDATEGLENELYEGQGLLSWGLSQPSRLAKLVSGFVKPSLSGTVLEVRIKLSQVMQSSQQDFITSMQNFERISKTLPTTFDYSNWNEYLRLTSLEIDNTSSNASTKLPVKTKQQRNQINTLQKARELSGRQNQQHMTAPFKTVKQQQSTQHKHARMIAQQAAATQANHPSAFAQAKQLLQKNATSVDAAGPADPPSPALLTPSSPPQMKTFAPPPAAVQRCNSLPVAPVAHEIDASLPTLARYTSSGMVETQADNTTMNRGIKRKASDLASNMSLSRPITFSPSKAVNAARHSVGAVQQLFKSKSPEGSGSTPSPLPDPAMNSSHGNHELFQGSSHPIENRNLPQRGVESSVNKSTKQRQEAQLLKALEDGQPVKFCFNCGNVTTRGNWRQFEQNGKKHNLCNACGVYWKTNRRMRPRNLWDRKSNQDNSRSDFPSAIPTHSGVANAQPSSTYDTPVSSDQDSFETTLVARTSPLKPLELSSFHDRARAVQSSPLSSSQTLKFASPKRHMTGRVSSRKENRPRTPTRETLHELPVNTPPQPPSPSPASRHTLEELSILFQTPQKQLFKLQATPSPWKSMVDLDDSPSRQNMDNFWKDLGNLDALLDLSTSPRHQQTYESLDTALSSSPGMNMLTSSAGMNNTDSTPDESEPPLSAQKLRTPGKSRPNDEHFEDGDSLFTPKRYNTRSNPNSVQRNLRSAGSIFGEQLFGEVTK